MSYSFKSAVHLFLIDKSQNSDRVLLLRRCNTGYKDGHYSVIAGHLEGDETTTEAMIREAKEEAGILIQSENLTLVGVMHRKSGDERIDFFFTCTTWDGIPKNMEPNKCDDLSWFSIDNFPDTIIPYVKRAWENFMSSTWFDTYGFD